MLPPRCHAHRVEFWIGILTLYLVVAYTNNQLERRHLAAVRDLHREESLRLLGLEFRGKSPFTEYMCGEQRV